MGGRKQRRADFLLGQSNREGTPETRSAAARLDRSAMQLRNPTRECQTHAQTATDSIYRLLALHEHPKDPLKVISGYTAPAVLHRQLNLIAFALHTNADRSASRGEANGVGQQIGQKLQQAIGVRFGP